MDTGDHSEEIVFDDNHTARTLFGRHDCNLRETEKILQVIITARGNKINISGLPDMVKKARALLEDYYYLIDRSFDFSDKDFCQALRTTAANSDVDFKELVQDVIILAGKNRKVSPKGPNQQKYIRAIREKDIVFGIGPAGTGKTYLAIAQASAALLSKKVNRIILTRPAVEAGERLGFLPGDLQEKINPYLRPLYDALYDMMTVDKVARLIDRKIIEIAPLAFMRGRTLNDCFVILDEAQNTTSEQMKMLLTRLGFNSKAVITGDVTQIDLPPQRISGLVEAQQVLQNVEGIGFVHFNAKDVMRHHLVAEIIRAYDHNQTGQRPQNGEAVNDR
jgi:phosphate starvation-inducible protein PhoH and related proteins